MLFREITGLDDVKQNLLKAVKNNQVAHALLFASPEGGANLAMALAFLTYLNCENRKDDDSCGACPSCHKNAKLIHPDVQFSFPVCTIEKKEPVSASFISDWRNFVIQDPYNNAAGWNNYFGGDRKQLNISKEESRQIIRNLSLKSFEGIYKVTLIWLPEYMHTSAANALLKIIEEPPANTIFLLVSNDEKRIIPTILSRTQVIYIRPFSDEETVRILEENHFIERERAEHIAHLVDGNINEALRLAREIEDDSHILFRDWMRICYQQNYTEMVQTTDKFQSLSKISQQILFSYGLSILRETLIYKNKQYELNRLMGPELEFIKNFSAIMSADSMEKMAGIFTNASHHLDRNANARIIFLDVSLLATDIFSKMKEKLKS